MDEARLPTELVVAATLRRCNAAGAPAFLVRRGEAERGTIILKLNRLEAGCEVWTQVRLPEGDLGWMRALKGETVAEAEAAQYIDRAVSRDPDLWVVEIEDRAGENPFEGRQV